LENRTFLKGLWYHAALSRDLKPGGVMQRVIMGEPIALARTHDGAVFALRDLCPHRGAPLSAGRLFAKGEAVDGETLSEDQLECPYHGWRFGADGRCAAIACLSKTQADAPIGKIGVRRYAVRERQGFIWVYMSDRPLDGAAAQGEDAPDHDPPQIPGFDDDARPRFSIFFDFNCHVDHAALGLIDPAHGPFVHRSWYWRTRASMHEKEKTFAPVERGFKMVKHQPSSNSFAYKLLGGKPTTEISFILPGVRFEHIEIGPKTVTGVTTATPIHQTKTRVRQTFFWDHPVMSALRPFLATFGKSFLSQDRDIIELQREGLKYEPSLMLAYDPDAQGRWYFQMKARWLDALNGGAPFQNPLTEPVTLRWRS